MQAVLYVNKRAKIPLKAPRTDRLIKDVAALAVLAAPVAAAGWYAAGGGATCGAGDKMDLAALAAAVAA